MGRRLTFGPAAQAGPACLHAMLLLPCAAPDRARARTLRGRHAPMSMPRRTVGLPRTPLIAPTSTDLRLPPLLHLICFLPSASASSSRSARLRHRPHQQLAGVGRSGCSSSPEPSLSCPEHRLLLAHLMLALVSHGKLPFLGNPSPELWPSSPEYSALWTSPLRPPSRSPFTRTSTARAR